jgi:hypothetical protein
MSQGRGRRRGGAAAAPIPTSAGAAGFRRPLLQVVVLFANDQRVLAYARSVSQKFMSVGVDVFLNTLLSEAGVGAALGTGAGSQYIKPDHLSTLISAMRADYLIVIGDRNMRNSTCQVRGGVAMVR